MPRPHIYETMPVFFDAVRKYRKRFPHATFASWYDPRSQMAGVHLKEDDHVLCFSLATFRKFYRLRHEDAKHMETVEAYQVSMREIVGSPPGPVVKRIRKTAWAHILEDDAGD